MEPYFMGQIEMFGGNFAPRGWALCDGQLLNISQYQALFSILGTMYGGDGRTTFGLPDLRGRVPMHAGTGPGLSQKRLGLKSGTPSTTLTDNTMPSHSHVATTTANLSLSGSAVTGSEEEAGDNSLGASVAYADAAPSESLRAGSIGGEVQVTVANSGNAVAFTNEQPFLAVNYIIALVGTFPSRN